MNKVFFYGNIANDPELKGNKNVLTFRIAVNSRQYNADAKQWEDSADFFDCVLYGKRAEAVGGFLAKGLPATIEAHAVQNTWTTDAGENRSRIEFAVDDIFIGRKA